MKILHLIDTLNPGGAERIAVNYVNTGGEYGIKSYLISTREMGDFIHNLKLDVHYEFLDRRRTIDLEAFERLIRFIKIQEIEIIHAHGTSWFLGVFCKIRLKNIRLIWHNHSGNLPSSAFWKKNLIKALSMYFDGIISVNKYLRDWNIKNLHCNNVIYLPNFVVPMPLELLKFDSKYKVVCISNLRRVKNHNLLINALDEIYKELDIELHLIGSTNNDEYSRRLIEKFTERPYIKFHGSIPNPTALLTQMDLGVLVSNYEGMPLTILEYAAAGLPVISTDVGNCKEVLGENSILISPGNKSELENSIRFYYENRDLAKQHAEKLHDDVRSNYSSRAIMPKYLDFCKKLCLKT